MGRLKWKVIYGIFNEGGGNGGGVGKGKGGREGERENSTYLIRNNT